MKNSKKSRFDLINLLKYGMVVVILVYIVILIMMQGGTKTSIKTMKENVTAVLKTDGMKKGTTQELKKFYGLNADNYKGVVLYIPDDVMGVNELLIVKLADKRQADSVMAAAQKRIDTQKESFEGYGAEQTKLINAAVLETRGDYVLMAVSQKADAAQKAFRKSL